MLVQRRVPDVEPALNSRRVHVDRFSECDGELVKLSELLPGKNNRQNEVIWETSHEMSGHLSLCTQHTEPMLAQRLLNQWYLDYIQL